AWIPRVDTSRGPSSTADGTTVEAGRPLVPPAHAAQRRDVAGGGTARSGLRRSGWTVQAAGHEGLDAHVGRLERLRRARRLRDRARGRWHAAGATAGRADAARAGAVAGRVLREVRTLGAVMDRPMRHIAGHLCRAFCRMNVIVP